MTSSATGMLAFTTKAWQRNQTLAAILIPTWAFVFALLMPLDGFGSLWMTGISAMVIIWSFVVARDFVRPLRGVVGVDGVRMLWRGSVVFLAFFAIDEVRREGDEIALVRAGQVLSYLRFSRRNTSVADAVFARIGASLQRVQEARAAILVSVVAASSEEALAQLARGDTDYRTAQVTRAQLWGLLEGPELDGLARRRVASALAATADEGERGRLRVAADGCADPKVRIALDEIARGEVDRSGPLPRSAI